MDSELIQEMRGLDLNSIPCTEIAGENIAQLLKVSLYKGTKALKSVVSRSQSPRIIHIGTHGFFLEDLEENNSQSIPRRLKQAGKQNPLMRSGVAFAGANTALQGGLLPSEAEGALLTAQDTTNLNLVGTELVVTAACKTALGNILISEGIFGLRMSFTMAGAQTLVMTLRNVPDLTTAILMEKFYYNLIKKNMGRAEALRKAQCYVRNLTVEQIRQQGWLTQQRIEWAEKRSKKIGEVLQELSRRPSSERPFKHPKHWGWFICQGNPAPLTLS